MRPLHRVVILGGGIAGIRLARRLGASASRRHLAVTLVSPGETHAYAPGLYQLAGAVTDAARRKALDRALALPIRKLLAGIPVSFVSAAAKAVDTHARVVSLDDGRRLAYDTLAVAIGSETSFRGIPGLREHAIALKGVRDADAVNRAIAAKLRGRATPLRITVAGAGPTGVELAAMLAEKVGKHPAGATVTLLEAGPSILPGYGSRVAGYVAKELATRGVAVAVSSPVRGAGAHAVTLADGTAVAHDVLVWTGGTQAPALLAALPLAKDQGRLAIDGPLRCVSEEGRAEIYALGDAACFRSGGTHAPWTVNVALQQADHAADNIVRRVAGLPEKAFVLRRQPFVIPLGSTGGIAEWLRIPFRGRIVQVLALLAEFRYLARLLPLREALSLMRKRVWGL